MARKRIGAAVFTLILLVAYTSGRADDATAAGAKIDNPLFVAWSKCEVGASSTEEMDFDGRDGAKLHASGTDTLKEKTADAVKLDETGKVGDHVEEPQIDTYPAKVSAADCKLTGEEEVKAMGKTFKCKVYEVTGVVVGQPAGQKMTIYVCDNVTGGLVKAIAHLRGGKDMTVMVTETKTGK